MDGIIPRKVAAAIVLAAALSGRPAGSAPAEEAGGRWTAGDLHIHTTLSDGGHTPEEIALRAFTCGLDWIAFSDHGGYRRRGAGGTRFPDVRELGARHPGKQIFLALEWNVPGHEHAVVGIVPDRPEALSSFESACDASAEGARKDALACVAALAREHPGRAWFLPNHPSRNGKYTAADLRAFHDAAPGVAFGFEGIPGYQKAPARGDYSRVLPSPSGTRAIRTLGGADPMAAVVGGTWDALLGEGRRFFLFANSDFHNTELSFWPGEYSRTHVFVRGEGPSAVLEGLRSGNSFAALGGLIDGLSFRARAGRRTATMGETLRARRGERLKVSVAFRTPAAERNGDGPRVDHVDLISGKISGKAAPGTEAYRSHANPTARVVARVTAREWTCRDGWCRATVDAGPASGPAYFRLRGTNLPPGTPGETDAAGNPLPDGGGEARTDLWFYSNPIFVDVPAGTPKIPIPRPARL